MKGENIRGTQKNKWFFESIDKFYLRHKGPFKKKSSYFGHITQRPSSLERFITVGVMKERKDD